MKAIKKRFETWKQAEHFQMHLYEEYDSVKLTDWPYFGELGLYVWIVS